MNIMLDLETLGTEVGSVILSIGAVAFSTIEGVLSDKAFYKVIDLQKSMDLGFTMSASTIKWWLAQDDKAREAVSVKGSHPIEVLADFNDWVKDSRGIEIWGNDETFDICLLKAYYNKLTSVWPFKYSSNRCFRTLKRIAPLDTPLPATVCAHNAVEDAIWQARFALNSANRLGVEL